jgi:plasmid stabilization system protein ParE
MGTFIDAPEAEEDIFRIWLHRLRESGVEMANRIEAELLEAFAGLTERRVKGTGDPIRLELVFFSMPCINK